MDMSNISDEDLNREYWRRVVQKREYSANKPGRKKVLHLCRFCSKEFGALEVRKHEPRCPENPKNKPFRFANLPAMLD